MFFLFDPSPVMEIPTDNPLTEEMARFYFRDVILGIEYCMFPYSLEFLKLSCIYECHLETSGFGASSLFHVLFFSALSENHSQRHQTL